MKKVLVVCQYYYPEEFRINDICENMAKRDIEVTVLTGLPNYPKGIVEKKYKFFRNRKETINGINVIRCSLIGRGNTKLRLVLNYVSFFITASWKSMFLKKNYDVVFVYQLSPVLQAIPGILYKKRTGKKLILSCQDIWPESLKTYNFSETSLIYKVLGNISKYIYSRADTILVSSPSFQRYLTIEHNVNSENIIYMPNHAENFYLQYDNVSKQNRDKIFLLFAGNIGKAQGLDILVQAIKKLSMDQLNKLHVDIVGDGSYLEEMKDLIAELSLTKVFFFHGRKKLVQMKPYYENADAFLLTLRGKGKINETIPSKVQGYMGAGKPIISAVDGDVYTLLEKVGCSLLTTSSDIEGLSKIISEFINNKNKFSNYGTAGRNYFIQNFTIDKYLDKLFNVINETRRKTNV